MAHFRVTKFGDHEIPSLHILSQLYIYGSNTKKGIISKTK
jgi:hypothetical protein